MRGVGSAPERARANSSRSLANRVSASLGSSRSSTRGSRKLLIPGSNGAPRSFKHAAAPDRQWGRQRFGLDAPAEQRLADLEDTLVLLGLDPAEHAPLLAPLVDIPLPPGRAAKLPPEELRRRQLAAMTAWVLAGRDPSPPSSRSRTYTGPTQHRSTWYARWPNAARKRRCSVGHDPS